jgi:hypothetical protein
VIAVDRGVAAAQGGVGPRAARRAYDQECPMLPSAATRLHTPTLPRADWPGYRTALLRSAYALLLVLVMLLPANFVAYAICVALYHGGAFSGARFALSHHLTGYWLGGASYAVPVEAVLWWVAAACEVLFWISCVSGLVIAGLWVLRGLIEQIGIMRPPARHGA